MDVASVFAHAVPAIVDVVGARAAYGFGNAAAVGVIGVFYRGAAADDFDETVFAVVGEAGVDCGCNGEWVGGGIAIEIVCGCSGKAGDGRVLVEGIGHVAKGRATSQIEAASNGFLAVADSIILVGAVSGVSGFIGGGELAAIVVDIRRAG